MSTIDPSQPPRDPPDDTSRGPKASTTGRSTLTTLLHHAVTALIVAVLLGIGVWLYLRFGAPPTQTAATGSDGAASTAALSPDSLGQARGASGRLRVERALEVARLTGEKYPENLTFLLREGLLVHTDLYYPSGDPKFEYRRDAENFVLDTLQNAGHDGAAEP